MIIFEEPSDVVYHNALAEVAAESPQRKTISFCCQKVTTQEAAF